MHLGLSKSDWLLAVLFLLAVSVLILLKTDEPVRATGLRCQEDEALYPMPDYPDSPLACVNIEELYGECPAGMDVYSKFEENITNPGYTDWIVRYTVCNPSS